MKVKKYAGYLPLVFTASLFACNSNNIDGGACTYIDKNYPAVVVKIEKKDSLQADIYFRIEDETGKPYRDSVSWSMEKKEYALLSTIKKDSIEIGKKYRYVVKQITSGHCTPKIEILLLEKYQ